MARGALIVGTRNTDQININVLGIVSEGGHDDDITDRRDVMPGRMEGGRESQGKRGGWEGESRDCSNNQTGITRLKIRQARPA